MLLSLRRLVRAVSLWVAVVGLLVFTSGVASATPVVVKNIATGIDDTTGQKLAYGTLDTDYVIGAGSAEGVGLVPQASQHYGWLSDGASAASRFIVLDIAHPESPHVATGNLAMPGTYSFITAVDLTGFVASSAQIENVRTLADNQLLEVIVNGTSVFSEATAEPASEDDYLVFQNLGSLGSGLMTSGINVIEFKLYNALAFDEINGGVNANPMGFRAEGLVTAEAIPEPSTALLLGVGLAGLGMRRRQRRRGD